MVIVFENYYANSVSIVPAIELPFDAFRGRSHGFDFCHYRQFGFTGSGVSVSGGRTICLNVVRMLPPPGSRNGEEEEAIGLEQVRPMGALELPVLA